MPPAHRFLDRWVVAAPIERVYGAIGDVRGYERWWTDFVIRATGDEAPPAPGKRNELLVKAYLPYKVNSASRYSRSRSHAASSRGSPRTSTARASGRWKVRPTGRSRRRP